MQRIDDRRRLMRMQTVATMNLGEARLALADAMLQQSLCIRRLNHLLAGNDMRRDGRRSADDVGRCRESLVLLEQEVGRLRDRIRRQEGLRRLAERRLRNG